MSTRLHTLPLALLIAACAETSGEHFEVPLFVQGQAAQPIPIRGGTLTLSRADVAIGPLYLCASKAAELELCESALAEHLDSHTFDALNAEPVQLGELSAVSGTVRGGFYDYGISWLLTQATPTASAGAVEGHSARFEGNAISESGESLRFVLEVDIAPVSRGASSVHGKSEEHTLRAQGDKLTLAVDAQSWFNRVRFDELAKLDDDGDGQVFITRDTQPYQTVVQSMTLNALPRLVWD